MYFWTICWVFLKQGILYKECINNIKKEDRYILYHNPYYTFILFIVTYFEKIKKNIFHYFSKLPLVSGEMLSRNEWETVLQNTE